MKKTTLFFVVLSLLCLLNNSSNAQAPNWLWAKSTGSINDDQANAIAVDASGNTYIAGWFDSDTVKFGSNSLINAGAYDIFLAKYDASGNVLWATRAGGKNYDYANSVAVDASGNIYVAGYFTSDTAWFGSVRLLNTGGTDYTADMFLVKYNSSGVVQWAKSATGLGDDKASSVAVDASGNAYVTGYFTSFYLTFGSSMLKNSDTTSYTDDIFLVKYNSSGTVQWAKSAGSIGWDEGISLAIDASGNSYVTGTFYSPTITFGATTLTNADNSGSTDDIFLVKYNTSGTVQWAKSAGEINYDEANSIALDASGNSYVAGCFSGTSITIGTTSLNNADSTAGTKDIFLAKYDVNGNVVWAKSAGGSSNDNANSVAVNASGDAFVSGYFSSPEITFGTSTLINNDTNNYNDLFLAKYDVNGNVLWAKSVGGSSDDEANATAVDVSGNAYVTGGFYSPTISFGTTDLINADNTTNTEDIFIAKLSAVAGINELSNAVNISVFPNPTSASITIVASKRSEIEILNLEGQVMTNVNTNERPIIIDVSSFARGLYFVKVTNEHGAFVEKFVKE